MKIAILTHKNENWGHFNPFIPLLKWKEEFVDSNIKFNYFNNHNNNNILNYEYVLINHRYFRNSLSRRTVNMDRRKVIEFLLKLTHYNIKICLFDTGDSTGSTEFDLIEYVDLFLKKQIFKDKNLYTQNNKKGIRLWVKEHDLQGQDYSSCPPSQLEKLKLGWNIGLCDYRNIHERLGMFSNKFWWKPKFTNSYRNRKYDISFRGSLMTKSDIYSFQRNKLIEFIKSLDNDNYNKLIGKKVSHRKYINELRRTKVTISPFGWGEICYRDFEAFLTGSILIKPKLDHFTTFPSIFKEYETYIPIDWQLSNLNEVFNNVLINYKEYKDVAISGQKKFKMIQSDSENFITHFKNNIKILMD